MRIRTVIGVLVLVATAAFFSGRAVSEEGEGEKGGGMGEEMTPEQAEMMKKWMEVATPGEPHKGLGMLAGTWDMTMTGMMMESASKGVSTFTSVLGGRFVRQEVKAEMGDFGPFEGIGYTGYDNMKKKYVMSWMDSMGTMMLHAEGLASKDGKEVRFWGTMDECTTGEHDKPVMYVHREVSKDEFVFEMHDSHMGMGGDGTTKVMSITYKRRK